MAKIELENLYDESDCETCGTSYAEGFSVLIDGEPFGDYAPCAHCYDGASYYLQGVLTDVLKHLGHELKFNYGE